MKEIYDFLKKCWTYYLATTEGNQPRVRPFGTINIFEDKLYILTDKKKDVSKQIGINPKIEVCAFDNNGKWLRIQAIAIGDDRREAKQSMLDSYPEFKNEHPIDDDDTQVLYFKDITATIYSFLEEKREIKF